jgi:hypothetical protein
MDRLNNILKQLETNESSPEFEKISELIKVSLQKNKFVKKVINFMY